MSSAVYRSGAEVFRGLLSSLSDRKPCKTKIIAFIGRSCKLLAECRLIAYPSQACSVSRTHTVEVTTEGRSSFSGADAGDFCIRNVWGFLSVRRNEYWWLDEYLTNPCESLHSWHIFFITCPINGTSLYLSSNFSLFSLICFVLSMQYLFLISKILSILFLLWGKILIVLTLYLLQLSLKRSV